MYSKLSIFDLDHTLLNVNSSFWFGLYLYRHKIISRITLIRCLIAYMRHKVFGMSIQKLHKKIFNRMFKGAFRPLIHEHVNAFLKEELSKLLYLPAVDRLRQAQQDGHYVAILSSSPDVIVEPIAHYFQVQEWVATQYGVDANHEFNIISRYMEGVDKANHVQELATKFSISRENITVYSDSYLDLPLLRSGGKSVCVSPDSQLRKIGLANGWDII